MEVYKFKHVQKKENYICQFPQANYSQLDHSLDQNLA